MKNVRERAEVAARPASYSPAMRIAIAPDFAHLAGLEAGR
jgi:hypothetical protein